MKEIKILPNEEDMPKQWYNLAADLPTPMQPPLLAVIRDLPKPKPQAR